MLKYNMISMLTKMALECAETLEGSGVPGRFHRDQYEPPASRFGNSDA